MNKFLLFLSLIFLGSSCQEDANKHQKDQIESLLQTCHERGIFNGNALIFKNDKILYRTEKGYTDGSKRKKLSKSSIFDIGSIAKEFNAVGIMILKERGKVNLDDKVSKYLLDLPPWSNKVSILNLLQYSSGLPSIDWENVHSDNDIYEDLRKLDTLEFRPGAGYMYSNNNIFLQRRIIEKVSGMSFNEFLDENILKSLSLENSVIDHQYANPDFVRAFNSENVNDEKLELKMSGWVCPSIDDLAKWADQLIKNKVISKESLHKLFETYSEESQSALGTGTFVDGELAKYEHHGSSLNYESIISYDLKENTLIVLMTNSKSLKIDAIAEAINNILQDKEYEVPQKSVYMTIRETTYQNVDKGIAMYNNLKNTEYEAYNFTNQWELARLSYKLFEKDQSDNAIKILNLLITELPDKSDEALGYLGNRILNENQPQKSISIYELMVDKFPSGDSFSGLGDAYAKNQQLNKARESYKKSLELDPKNEITKKKLLQLE